MPAVMQPPSEEKEQGQVQVDEALEKQTANAAPTENVAPPPPVQPGAEGFTVRNRYMLLPPQALLGRLGGERPPSEPEKNHNVGLLFESLAKDDPTMRAIADELLGKNRG